jgi:EAL domain-containing protein (putative c-di-GMP-specific phosphodiesterase class I)
VVAEGVEAEAWLATLIKEGCDGPQGYHFSRACPAEQLAAWLTDSPFGMPAEISR